jgi:outer membrane protein assembly factor BamB
MFADYLPPVVADETRVYANLLGIHVALDARNGKLLWRTGRFHDLAMKVQQNQFWFPEQYSLNLVDGQLWSMYRDPDGSNRGQQAFRLARLDPATGREVWNSGSQSDLATWSFSGRPLVTDGRVIVAARKLDQAADQYVLALRADSGQLLWSTHLGTHQVDPNEVYYDRSAQPDLVMSDDRLFVETHVGALLQLDPWNGEIRWAYVYESEVNATNRFFYDRARKRRTAAPPLVAGERLFSKGMRSGRLNALEPDGPAVSWTRPIGQEAMVVGVEGERLYLGGDELMALDLKSKKLLWASRMPASASAARPIMTSDRLFQFTSRGVFEVDKSNGDVVRQFRGADPGALGGVIVLTPDRLITVSNLCITAYNLPTGRPAGVEP